MKPAPKTPARRYDVLLCDADDTLFDFKQAEANAFSVACRAAGIDATPALLARYSAINDALWKLFERGGITQEALRVRRFEQFLAASGIDADPRAVADAFVLALSRQAVLLPGAAEAVARWRRILPVVVVTNGLSAAQRGRMALSPLKDLISDMIVSEEAGAAKPDPRMLLLAMERAGVRDRSRALLLGDSLSSDIRGAANAGIDACWYNPRGLENAPGLPVRYEIRDLGEVDAILLGAREEGD